MNTVHQSTDSGSDDLLSLLDALAKRTATAIPAGEDQGDDVAPSPAEKFEQFHEENQAVYAAMVALSRQWVGRTGRRKLGINSLIERVRWEIALRTNDPDFKINNNHAPFYSRLIMRQEPDLADLFDVRRSAADEWIGGQAA